MTDLLHSKTAILYGAGGDLGGAVARTFAREGATVYLAGRTREPLERVAADIAAEGGRAHVAVADALDQRAVDEHADAVAAEAGAIDVSFNLISRGDVQGRPIVDLGLDELLGAITAGATTLFLTARAAARHMAPRGSGVILHLTSGSSRGAAPMMGSTGPATQRPTRSRAISPPSSARPASGSSASTRRPCATRSHPRRSRP